MAVTPLKIDPAELFSQLREAFFAKERGEIVDLAGYQAQVERWSRISAADASVMKSILAACNWDQAGATYWIRNFLALQPISFYYRNAMETARAVNLWPDALDYSIKAFHLDSNNEDRFFDYVATLETLGKFTDAVNEIARSKYASNERYTLFELQGFAEFLRAIERSEASLTAELIIALEVASSQKKRVIRIEHTLDEDGYDEKSLTSRLIFFGNLKEEMMLESLLASHLSVLPDWSPASVSVEFSYTENNAS